VKKLLTLSVVLILVAGSLLAAGCRGKVQTYTDPGQRINVGTNQEFVIALNSNPTTGYDWEENYDDSMLILAGKEYRVGEKAAGLVGAGGTQYYRFRSVGSGSTEITLSYKRPWEEEVLERKVFTVDIK
jgi:inhibitor of cysteine peptidase